MRSKFEEDSEQFIADNFIKLMLGLIIFVTILFLFFGERAQAQTSNYDSTYVEQLETSVVLLYTQLSEACHYGYAYELTFNGLTENRKRYFEVIDKIRTEWLNRNMYLYERCSYSRALIGWGAK